MLWPATDLWRLREEFGRSEASLFHRAYELGLKKAGRSGFYRPSAQCRYAVDEQAFEVLTPETAYVLGFVLADGRVDRARWVLHIWQNDREHLLRVRAALGSEHPIAEEHRGASVVYRLTIGRKRLIEPLVRLGLTERKTWDATLPEVPDELFGHFLRGYFDGDGSINAKAGGVAISFTGVAPDLLEQLAERLSGLYGVARRPVRTYRADRAGHEACRLMYFGHCVFRLGDAMYNKAGGLFLSRKRERLDSWRKRYHLAPLA